MRVAAVAVLPLLLTLVLIALLVTKNSYLSLRHNLQFWLVTAYILLLLAAPAVIKLLPAEGLADIRMQAVSEEDIVAGMTGDRGDLYMLATQGRPEQAEGVLALGKWGFPFQGGATIEIMENRLCEDGFSGGGVTIVAERKDRADGIIEVVNYANRTIIERLDFSSRVRPHEVTLNGNVLMIAEPARLKVVLGIFNREFVTDQIIGENSPMFGPDSGGIHNSTIYGTQLLYLRIPADVEAQSDIPIDYVEK